MGSSLTQTNLTTVQNPMNKLDFVIGEWESKDQGIEISGLHCTMAK